MTIAVDLGCKQNNKTKKNKQPLGTFCHILANIICTGLDKQKCKLKIVNIFFPISLKYVLGAQKNRLIEAVLICFG